MPPLAQAELKSRHKAVTKDATTVVTGDVPVDLDGDSAESSLVKTVRLKLERAGLVIEESFEAQQALRIAEQMSGRETAGGMAALSKELSRLTAEALRSAVTLVADPVDELKAKREEKWAAAG